MGFLNCMDLQIREITESCKPKKRLQHGSKSYLGSKEEEQLYRDYLT
jgi:hypothetical protein